jgi:hypothetical protein
MTNPNRIVSFAGLFVLPLLLAAVFGSHVILGVASRRPPVPATHLADAAAHEAPAARSLAGIAGAPPGGSRVGGISAGLNPLIGRVVQNSAEPATASSPADLSVAAESSPLVQAGDLAYQGAFRLPQGTFGGSSFAYGGAALAFNPAGGSLFMVGHPWQEQVAEFTVPEIRRATRISDLATARVLQPFADATEGRLPLVGPNTVNVGGLLPYQGQLYLSAYVYYDGLENQFLSHFVSGLDLSVRGDVQGPYHVGTGSGAGLLAGYFGLVPKAWQAALGGPVLNGQCCLSIISRTSLGPAVFTIDPTQLGRTNPVPATGLVYYPLTNPLDSSNPTTQFNLTTQMGGVVFPEGTRSVLFFGRQGLGNYCYGEAAECGDPAVTSKGPHAFPYAYYVWAYDALDLMAVKNGQRQPWDVKPYAVWELNFPFAVQEAVIGGAAYDPVTGRIFVSQYRVDSDNPLIHVFTVGSGSSSSPQAPSVSLLSPTAGASFAPLTSITLSAAATEVDGSVSSVTFFANGASVGTATSSPYTIDWPTVPAGTYRVIAVATDSGGHTSTSSAVTIVVQVPSNPLSVSLVSPPAGVTFSGPVPITLTATAVDSDSTVKSVAFYANGALIGTATSSPYSVTWSGAVAGSYALSAVATDNAGRTATSDATTVLVGLSSQTLLTTQMPAITSISAGTTTLDLGTRLISDVSGLLTAIRFWKSPSETGSHTGRIWSASGQMLASVIFTNETASGWQQQSLPTPLSALANTEYVVSVNTGSNGYFAFTAGAFDSGLVNGHLRVPAANGGPYGLPGIFPATVSSNNFFRDVVFVVDGGDGGPTSSAGDASITPTVVEAQPASLSITQPTDGAAVSGHVTIAATVSNAVGAVGVQFQVDGLNIGSEVAAAPYRVDWNTTGVANGSRTLTAILRDGNGQHPAVSVTVTVGNRAPRRR